MSAIPMASERPAFGSIALKGVMALTGLVLYGFVFIHMVGNLQLYSGPEKINKYAAFLKGTPAVLWGFRFTLLAAVTLHAVAAFLLWSRNRAARPVGYASQDFQAATITSRTMYWTGPMIGLFVVYHLLHLTVGSAHPSFSHTDVYSNVVSAFANPAVSIFYILAMVALGFHLFHGAYSLFQTLGLRTPKYEKPLKAVLMAVSTVIVVVNVSFPIAVLAGLVRPVAS
ncbi:succinate dehydrogenase cytochrome b subunit [bacterium]|nr:succinate dehydrogenase cytochrome b subunit [bacterium]